MANLDKLIEDQKWKKLIEMRHLRILKRILKAFGGLIFTVIYLVLILVIYAKYVPKLVGGYENYNIEVIIWIFVNLIIAI